MVQILWPLLKKQKAKAEEPEPVHAVDDDDDEDDNDLEDDVFAAELSASVESGETSPEDADALITQHELDQAEAAHAAAVARKAKSR